ncbi:MULTISPECIES: RluA family pseudouridine synthase [Saccharibacillus]|uniref:RluA family pseudouridine synthase n=1 Tax=Saccharibacillus TaxID=456492 RepID=UPI00123B98B5|nr:RluA family pseudouridine synthase [Saccharibacillus sp. WB 17]MWJ31668.1 RluA family pseudouridine synthase [Saccharibacillus sp. WB 17]
MARSWTRRGEWIETALPAAGSPAGGAEAAAPAAAQAEDAAQAAAPLAEANSAASAEVPAQAGGIGPENAAAAALGVPEKLARRLRHAGEIQVRGSRVKLRLRPDEDLGFEPVWTEDGLEALHEDDFCLVVRKPAGMPVHPDGGAKRLTLANVVAAHLQMHGEACAVHHVHRLDEHTSGPVLYAKGELARLALDEQMREKSISRVYLAIVEGKFPNSLRVINAPIGRDRHHNSRRRVSPGGQEAVTRVRLVRTLAGGRASLVRLVLETGRTHQIRVHMAHAGYPLIGDVLYGGSDELLDRQALHGESLSFKHPFSGELIEVSDPLPADLEALLHRLT